MMDQQNFKFRRNRPKFRRQETIKAEVPNPCWLNAILFCYINTIFDLGFKRAITEKDLFGMPKDIEGKYLFENGFNRVRKSKRFGLLYSLLKLYYR